MGYGEFETISEHKSWDKNRAELNTIAERDRDNKYKYEAAQDF